MLKFITNLTSRGPVHYWKHNRCSREILPEIDRTSVTQFRISHTELITSTELITNTELITTH
jgi:hypothetical protein